MIFNPIVFIFYFFYFFFFILFPAESNNLCTSFGPRLFLSFWPRPFVCPRLIFYSVYWKGIETSSQRGSSFIAKIRTEIFWVVFGQKNKVFIFSIISPNVPQPQPRYYPSVFYGRILYYTIYHPSVFHGRILLVTCDR